MCYAVHDTSRANQELIVTFTKDGYEPQTLTLTNQVAGGGVVGVAGNLIIGGVVGAAVDAGTGAALDHTPNPLKAIMAKLPENHKPPAGKHKEPKVSAN